MQQTALQAKQNGSSDCPSNEDSFEPVMLTLTLPLWTFIMFYLLIMLIHHLRRIQHFELYDKCTVKNAHFRYDFHILVGKHSINYNRFDSRLIVDLLDNQLISTMTIQVPGLTIFSDEHKFISKHPRSNLRSISFTIYRRSPIKDVHCVRVAHSCSNPDSRIVVYGVDLYDATNGENKFFPITSLVKYRGTQWALVTTFEAKNDLSFQKLGTDTSDPFGYSIWPTYVELLTILLYIWCATFCFGHLIPVKEILQSVPLHSVAILFITGCSAVVISFVYLKLIKTHITDEHFDSIWWMMLKYFTIALVMAISFSLWFLSIRQSEKCLRDSMNWIISTLCCSTSLTLIFLVANYILKRKKMSSNQSLLDETNASLMRTNSKPSLEFVNDTQIQQRKSRSDKTHTLKTSSKAKTSSKKKTDEQNRHRDKRDDDETLDNAHGTGSKYIKTKNRNSISQYV